MKKLIISTLFLLMLSPVFAQLGASIWYFGQFAGLDFRSGSPVALTDGFMWADEGVATICDDNTGDLLFYTDGKKIWDSNHTQMPNGDSLLGHESSTQSAIIIPNPGDTSQFYVFTVDAGPYTNSSGQNPHDGLQYSIVDMDLNGGDGDVISKNNPLVNPVSEKLTGVMHGNNQDIWVITHKWESDTFYAYQVTPTGINPPVKSKAGRVHSSADGDGSCIGYMKTSPDGSKLALAIYTEVCDLEIFDFNTSTGVVSNCITRDFPYNNALDHRLYGVEFSPSSQYLYVSLNVGSMGKGTVYQYDMNAGDSAAILASETEVGYSENDYICALQLAIDGKIYVANNGETFLNAINNPDVGGMGCDYQEDVVSLSGRECYSGLPTYIASHFYLPVELIAFSGYNDGKVNRLQWKTATETNNDYFTLERSKDGNAFEPFHTISGAGNASSQKNYEAVDNTPYKGTTYYRLKQTDIDGSVEYSRVISIIRNDDFIRQIYPVPAKNNITFMVDKTTSGNINVQITDLQGRELIHKEIIMESGVQQYTLNVNELASGMYFFTAQSDDNLYEVKFLKQ